MVSKKIKVCWVANNDVAIKFLLLPQLNFLIKEGYDIYVVCSGGKWIEDIKKDGIKVKVIGIKRKISPFYDMVTLYRLWSYFRKEKFDIVHTNNPKPGLLGQVAAKMAGVPIIVNTIHGLYFQDNSSNAKRMFFILMEKGAAACSDLIFSVNKEDINTLIKEKISSPEKIKYLGNGVGINKFDSDKFSKEFIDIKKKELNIPVDDYKVVGIVARLVEEKGYLDLFEAFRLVLTEYLKTILLIIGADEPTKRDAIKPEIVKKYGIEKNVIFLGERNDVNEIFPLMDIFVLPSHREGLPMSVIEAMAEKRAIVATNIRGSREEIEDGKSGILVPVKDPVKLSEAMVYLLKNEQKSSEMAEAALVRVKKEFDEKLVFDRIKKEYQRLIEEKIYERAK